ncbi:MAG: hypothetical protein JNK59_04050 [Sterolibacteriaceae bacterium]|nr:hypothetical protein [Sterolibacteriaceae bacterium]
MKADGGVDRYFAILSERISPPDPDGRRLADTPNQARTECWLREEGFEMLKI